MSEVNGVIGRADLRPFVRVEKVGHKSEHTLLALGSYGAATGARCSARAISWGGRKRCDGDRVRIDGGGRSGGKSVRIPIGFPGELI